MTSKLAHLLSSLQGQLCNTTQESQVPHLLRVVREGGHFSLTNATNGKWGITCSPSLMPTLSASYPSSCEKGQFFCDAHVNYRPSFLSASASEGQDQFFPVMRCIQQCADLSSQFSVVSDHDCNRAMNPDMGLAAY